jgi:hypothetical protein
MAVDVDHVAVVVVRERCGSMFVPGEDGCLA